MLLRLNPILFTILNLRGGAILGCQNDILSLRQVLNFDLVYEFTLSGLGVLIREYSLCFLYGSSCGVFPAAHVFLETPRVLLVEADHNKYNSSYDAGN